MKENILKALLRLFAIIANVDNDDVSTSAKIIVKSYLKEHLNQKLVKNYLNLFNEFLQEYHRDTNLKDISARKKRSKRAVKILKYCYHINAGLQQKDKFIILIRLLEFVNEDDIITPKEYEFIEIVNSIFKINKEDFNNCKNLVLQKSISDINKNNLLVIDGKESAKNLELPENGAWFEQHRPDSLKRSKHIYNENLNGKIHVLNIQSINCFIFIYRGEDSLYLNSLNIIPNRIYLFNSGALIRGNKIKPIYYSDISGKFINDKNKRKIVFEAHDIIFYFKDSTSGVQKMSIREESGQMLGIMGGSGVGKSTLLNVLNGSLPLNEGEIFINGYNFKTDSKRLEGVIGFVPQDDFLIEELTVFENLYYNAKLCFSNLNNTQINKRLLKLMTELDLYEAKDLKVGNPINKFISGGQRKRLNIALELMREPSILIIDEPTSGLSSQDSEVVMTLLKEQSNKGKLVIVNIHQPSSDIFKLFDRLLVLDRGGYMVYYGNPIDSIVHFKNIIGHVNADERDCVTCGNVNPEQVLQIIETREINEYGHFTTNRKVSPEQWNKIFIKKDEENENDYEANFQQKLELPINQFKIPGSVGQFKIFSLRNLKSKLTNKQYMLISLLEAPLLAFILGFFTKYNHGTNDNPFEYIFSENVNIPAYLFMCVIVSLFLGLTISAEEIIRDKRILKRESFLNLSRSSYIHSKIVFLFVLSAVQMALFVVVGNTILEIKGMGLSYWLILFTTACFANMVGLNISSGLNSVVNIYILIPFILVPQLLLSGVIVDFNKLHKSVSDYRYVPVVGDFMTSRWAYEALSVEQFKNNKFNRQFYEYDQKIEATKFEYVYRLPRMETMLNKCEINLNNDINNKETESYLNVIRNEIQKLNTQFPYSEIENLEPENISNETIQSAKGYIKTVSTYYSDLQMLYNSQKDSVLNAIVQKSGKDVILKLKKDCHNKRLAEMIQKKAELKKIVVDNNEIIQIYNPIYKYPETNIGRAHFYAPVKKLFGTYYDTFWFNISFIWLTSFFLYLTLQHDSLRKMFDYLKSMKLIKRHN